MADRPERPDPTEGRVRAAEERREKQAQAMRANLRRRKEQQRARERPAAPPEGVEEG
jgi:hypothetical protein